MACLQKQITTGTTPAVHCIVEVYVHRVKGANCDIRSHWIAISHVRRYSFAAVLRSVL
jgi:hypothetical protein